MTDPRLTSVAVPRVESCDAVRGSTPWVCHEAPRQTWDYQSLYARASVQGTLTHQEGTGTLWTAYSLPPAVGANEKCGIGAFELDNVSWLSLARVGDHSDDGTLWMNRGGGAIANATTYAMHTDNTYSEDTFLAQVLGIKDVRLVAPHHWPWLQLYPMCHRYGGDTQVRPSASWLSVLARFPIALRSPADLYRMVTLAPGDMLYIPPAWYHETTVVGEAASVRRLAERPLPKSARRLRPPSDLAATAAAQLRESGCCPCALLAKLLAAVLSPGTAHCIAALAAASTYARPVDCEVDDFNAAGGDKESSSEDSPGYREDSPGHREDLPGYREEPAARLRSACGVVTVDSCEACPVEIAEPAEELLAYPRHLREHASMSFAEYLLDEFSFLPAGWRFEASKATWLMLANGTHVDQCVDSGIGISTDVDMAAASLRQRVVIEPT